MPKEHYIELVGKIVKIIETLRDAPDGLSLQELAARTRFVKSSVHRILQSLRKHGYIEQDGVGGRYHLGLQFLPLARNVSQGLSLPQAAQPYLKRLVGTFDETSYLVVLHSGRAVFIDVRETSRGLRLVRPLGAEASFHATAAGKVIAGFLPPEQAAALLKEGKFEALTARTVTDPCLIQQSWMQAHEQGYAVNDEETMVGVVFLAAPVFDTRGIVCGSVSMGIPKPRYTERLGKQIAKELKAACRELSTTLEVAGYIHEKPR